jgi:peptide-methionine (R)-S-oxide reductase
MIKMEKIKKTDLEWKSLLTEEQYLITRRKGTEPAFCGTLYDHKQAGIYHCICCDLELFSAEHKFDSGTGWPSFFRAVNPEHIQEKIDLSHGMIRTEIACARCDAHLGHVFKDGPKPSGLRYCLNSVALRFVPEENQEVKDE